MKRATTDERNGGDVGNAFRTNDRWVYIIYTSPTILLESPLRIGKTRGETIVLLLVVLRRDDSPAEDTIAVY